MSEAKPVAWTLQSALDAGYTTNRAYLWFSHPKNSAWVPLYDRATLDAAVSAAVAAERERCAKLCESMESWGGSVTLSCAAAIRVTPA